MSAWLLRIDRGPKTRAVSRDDWLVEGKRANSGGGDRRHVRHRVGGLLDVPSSETRYAAGCVTRILTIAWTSLMPFRNLFETYVLSPDFGLPL